LSLITAANFPVAGVVAISTPYLLARDPRLPYVKLLHYLQPKIQKGPPDWRNPQAALDHIDYPYYPTRAIAELRDLLVEMRQALPQVKVPALLFHSRHDTGGNSFDITSMQMIYDHLGTADKEMVWVENSGHVIVREPDREAVFQKVNDFILRVESAQKVAP